MVFRAKSEELNNDVNNKNNIKYTCKGNLYYMHAKILG